MNISNLKIFKAFVLIGVFLIATPSFASQFYFETKNTNVSVGQTFQVDLNINTDRENINALEGRIVFSEDILELTEIRSADSIVNFWVDKPTYKAGSIVFSGITPGGYVLDKGLVLSLIFKTKAVGYASIQISDSSALKNDGLGTKSALKNTDLKLSISSSSSGVTELETVRDNISPDTFRPEIAQDPNLLDNKWFVVFLAQDKQSGVVRYELKESKSKFFRLSKWKNAESPYVLEDQSLNSYIYIKAIDKEGNKRVVKLSPKNPIVWYANIDNWFIIVLVTVVALTIFFFSKKKK